MANSRKLTLGIAAGVLLAGSLAATDINKLPPDNWTVPKTTGLHTLTDATSPRPFIGLAPCRLVDTRGTGGVPINTGGRFAANEARTWTFAGLCGLPAGTDAVSLNVTVTNTGGETGFGFVKVWPAGGSEPNVSTLNFASAGLTVANAAIVALSGGGSISLRSGNNSSDVIVDVNGYFSDRLGNPSNYFLLTNNSGLYTAYFQNLSGTCAGDCGLVQTVASGVAGHFSSPSDIGVRGHSGSYNGVWADSNTWDALAAFGGRDGGYLQGNRYGVVGGSASTSGTDLFGVVGFVDSGGARGSGVIGEAFLCCPANASGNRAGVQGITTGDYGVWGRSYNAGFAVAGHSVTTAGVPGSVGYLGFSNSTAVYASGDLGASGVKTFVDPHPTDATKYVRYVSLEGPEAGTYFRGRGTAVRGLATIQIPEDFRIVTSPDGLSIQVTPIGEIASVAVVEINLDRIVVKLSRDVDFFYTVNGVRSVVPTWDPIQSGEKFFIPESPDARLPGYLRPEAARRLIANGTYNEDGTVNMNTAERVGWTRIWEQRAEEEKAAQARAAARFAERTDQTKAVAARPDP